MGYNKQKLELTWIGKERRPDAQNLSPVFYWKILLAFKALEQKYTGTVKCYLY